MGEKDKNLGAHIISPALVILCMVTVIYKGGNADFARSFISILCSLLIAATILIEKKSFQFFEWLPGLVLFTIPIINIFTHNLLWEQALLWGALALSYWVIVLSTSTFDMAQTRIVLIGLFGIVIFELLYGIANRVTNGAIDLGLWQKVHYLDSATGTFVNRNHYAGFLAMSWPISLATIALLTPQQRIIRYFSVVVISVLFVTALLLAKSRMGAFAGLVGIITYITWQVRRDSSVSRRTAIVIGFCFALIMIFATLWVGVGDIGKRYILSGESFLFRSTVWQSLFDFPARLWFEGIGVNQFEQRFPQVQPIQLKPHFVYAHNDYLQATLELGIAGTTIYLLSLLNFFRIHGFGTLDTKRRAAWCGILAILLHEIVDFNLHMPGNAVAFAFLLGLTLNNFAYSDARLRLKESNRDNEIDNDKN